MENDSNLAPLRSEPDQRPDMQPTPRPPRPSTSIYVSSGDRPDSYADAYGSYRSSSVMTPEVASLKAKAEIERINLDNKLLDSQLAVSQENWIKSYWRPAMGWLYGFICLMDFVIFPIIVMVLPVYSHKYGVTVEYAQWQPLTLQASGLIHVAFGAILGIAAWTRGNSQKSFIEK